MFGPLRLVRSLSDAQIEAMADPRRAPHAGLPTIEDAVRSGAYLCGPPAQLIDMLRRLETGYPALGRVCLPSHRRPGSGDARAARAVRRRGRAGVHGARGRPRRFPSGAAGALRTF